MKNRERFAWLAVGAAAVATSAIMVGSGIRAESRCVGVAAAHMKDGEIMVFRAFEDGRVESRNGSVVVDKWEELK
jgi:hypothetical protein